MRQNLTALLSKQCPRDCSTASAADAQRGLARDICVWTASYAAHRQAISQSEVLQKKAAPPRGVYRRDDTGLPSGLTGPQQDSLSPKVIASLIKTPRSDESSGVLIKLAITWGARSRC